MNLAPALAGHLHLVLLASGAALVLLAGFLAVALYRARRRTPDSRLRQGEASGGMLAVWGVIGALALLPVAVSALRITYLSAAPREPDMTVTVIGRVGSWTYGYSGEANFRFDSRRLDAGTARSRLQPVGLAADFPMVVPVGRTVEIRATAADIGHLWSVPALGVGIKAMPGRIGKIFLRIDRPGMYYGPSGQEAPIAIKAVEAGRYRGWLAWARRQYESAPPADETRK